LFVVKFPCNSKFNINFRVNFWSTEVNVDVSEVYVEGIMYTGGNLSARQLIT